MDRALASGAKGRGFEPLQARHFPRVRPGHVGYRTYRSHRSASLEKAVPFCVIVIKNTLGQIKCEQVAMEGNPEFGVDLQQTSTLPPAVGATITK